MKSTIIFFDTYQNSIRGTLRGAILIPFIFILSYIWYGIIMKNTYKNHIYYTNYIKKIVSICLSIFIIISAIGVHNPDTLIKAIVYSALVGFVIYGSTNSILIMTLDKWSFKIAIIDILFGIISTSLLGLILYIFTQQFKYLKPI